MPSPVTQWFLRKVTQSGIPKVNASESNIVAARDSCVDLTTTPHNLSYSSHYLFPSESQMKAAALSILSAGSSSICECTDVKAFCVETKFRAAVFMYLAQCCLYCCFEGYC